MTTEVNLEYLQVHVGRLFYEPSLPYNPIEGAFGRCKPRFVRPRLGSEECAIIVDLPTLNPVTKGLWKTQSYYGARQYVNEAVVVSIISE